MKAQKPVEVKPGRLMTNLSADSVGVANYTIKRDFRRVLERDIRAEGYEWFRPNPLYDKVLQSIPSGSSSPITLISECNLPNGRIAIIAGNQTTLWRYTGLEDPAFYDSETSSNYFDTEGGLNYFADGMAGWKVIGSGFSASGNRWEFAQVGSFLVLNNGLDLPVTYNLQEDSVKPIYELREQQVACVGTIATIDGILCCMDITQINDGPFLSIMQPVAAAVNASQDSTGKISPAAATLFPGLTPASLVGLTLFWSSGSTTHIDSLDGSGFLKTNASFPVNDSSGRHPFSASWTPTYSAPVISAQAVSAENALAYALFNDVNSVQRVGSRFFPSMPFNPRRFGAVVPVAFKVGSQTGTLLYPVRSIPELVLANYAGGAQTPFKITNIGIGGTNLVANVLSTGYGITQTVFLDKPAMTEQPFGASTLEDQIQSANALIEASDAAASFAGVFEDLEDDEGRIIKALPLQGQLVIYKETPFIFLASYTGDLTTPFQFQRIPIQAEAASLYHRNTLIAGGGGYFGSYHLYAAKNGFYKFSIFSGVPTEEPLLQACADTFFANASDNENTFAIENPLTREIFFVFPHDSASLDNAICLDYAFNSVRTTSASITAATRARHPVTRDYWFIMGQSDGSLKRYGLFVGDTQSSGTVTATLAAGTVTASADFFLPSHVGRTISFSGGLKVAVAEYVSPRIVTTYSAAGISIAAGQVFSVLPSMWHRDGQPYESIMQSGQDAFGLSHGEKTLTEYVISLSSKSPNCPLALAFRGGINADAVDIQSTTIPNPAMQNLVKPTLQQYYLGFRVTTIAGINNPVEITGHLLNVLQATSHSFGRRPL